MYTLRLRAFCSILFCFYILSVGCVKMVEVNAPFTSTNAGNVFSDNSTAAATVTGVYATMSYNNYYSFTSEGVIENLSLLLSLGADELTLYSLDASSLNSFYTNSLIATSAPTYWSDIYALLFRINSIVEGLDGNQVLNSSVQKQLMGEAKFLRAFCYFHLVNMYGDVPLALSSDPNVNASLSRSNIDKVYQQIISDLKDAENLLAETYLSADVLTPTAERVRPTKWAAAALLARVYLYTKNYPAAEEQSSLVINNASMFQLTAPDKVFLKNSNEAIWQLQPVVRTNTANTGEGLYFILPDGGPNTSGYAPVYLSADFVSGIDPNDLRKKDWIDSVVSDKTYYFSYKYKVGAENPDGIVSEYIMVLRLGEQYLIRAESRAEQEKTVGALYDLNMIRSRAGLPEIVANDKESILTAILNERKIEFFTEGGHRWFDLKRLGKINDVMSTVCTMKGGTWSPNWQYYPIPQSEIQANSALIQNNGYN